MQAHIHTRSHGQTKIQTHSHTYEYVCLSVCTQGDVTQTNSPSHRQKDRLAAPTEGPAFPRTAESRPCVSPTKDDMFRDIWCGNASPSSVTPRGRSSAEHEGGAERREEGGRRVRLGLDTVRR